METNSTASYTDRPGTDAAVVLFGTAPSRIFDAIADRVDSALRYGVSSLPFLPPTEHSAQTINKHGSVSVAKNDGHGDKQQQHQREAAISGDERLLSILRTAYGANLDIAEAYAVRNVFSLPPASSGHKKRGEAIITAYLSGGGRHDGGRGGAIVDKENAVNGPTPGGCGGNPNDASAGGGGGASKRPPEAAAAAAAFDIPKSKSDVPTATEVISIETETDRLRARLRAARRLKSDLKLILTKLGRVENVARVARQTVDESVVKIGGGGGGGIIDGNGVHDKVTAAVVRRDGLTNLTKSGTELIKSLDEEKEARRRDGSNGGGADEEEALGLMMAANAVAAAKKMKGAKKHVKPSTIEEDMERRRKVVRTGDGRVGLGDVTGLLRER